MASIHIYVMLALSLTICNIFVNLLKRQMSDIENEGQDHGGEKRDYVIRL